MHERQSRLQNGLHTAKKEREPKFKAPDICCGLDDLRVIESVPCPAVGSLQSAAGEGTRFQGDMAEVLGLPLGQYACFFELFSCLWPVAQDSGQEWLFSSDCWCAVEFVDGVLCRTLFWKNPGWWAGRREEGVWLEGLVSGERRPLLSEET